MFAIQQQNSGMIIVEPDRSAALVASIHSPWRATVADCVHRWSTLDAVTRAGSYLVVEGDEPGLRRTLNGCQIADLATRLAPSRLAA